MLKKLLTDIIVKIVWRKRNMTDKPKTIVIRGILNYAKVLGKPRKHTGLPKYDKGPYWSVDVTPDAKSLALIESLDLEDKLRPRKKADEAKIAADGNRVGTGKFLSFRHLLNRTDGGENEPIRIVDARGMKWSDGKLIGNGTVADVKVRVVDYGPGSDKGTYIQAMRILDHVSYESDEFGALSEDDAYFVSTDIEAEEQVTSEDDLSDDVPF
jgi:hypothetical protein